MARGSSSRGTLKFNQTLTGIPSGEQLKRLQALHIELAALDQDTVDAKSLDKVREKLVNASLLLGKDKGVKAYTCCCLADLLRLYAPDCPYEEKELKDIFQFFIRQLKYFTGPSCPNYSEYFYLIESLSNVKSATLMATLPGAEQLMTEMAKQFFDLARPDMPKNVLSHLAEVLIQVINEADILPSDMVDVILAQFLPRNVKANPTSVQLAVEVCNQTNEKLQRYVAQYFTEVLSPDLDEDDEGMDSEEETTAKAGRKGKNGKASTSKADAADFILTHDLIKSITRSCPALLANVIPLLEEELVSEDKGVRILATQTLGEMFSDRPADKAGSLPAMMGIRVIRADLAKKYPKTWRSWLGRSRDKEAQVRLAVLECTKDILAMHHELGRDIYEVMHGRLVDPDDKIRAAACAAFSTVDYESALHAFDKSTLKDLAARMQDKRPAVQKEALNSLGRMYNNAFNEISNGDAAAIERFCWIPEEILKGLLLPDRVLHASTERVLHDFILPLPPRPEEESYYVDRLLLVMHYLDTPGQKALLRAARLFEKRPLIYDTYLHYCTEYNGGNVDQELDTDDASARLKAVCKIVSGQFPDPVKAEADLHKFAKLNDHRAVKLLRTLMDPDSDSRTISKNLEEVLKRVEKASSNILDTIAILIRRSGFLLINRSTIPHLFERISRASEASQAMLEIDEEGDADAQVQSFGRIAKSIVETIIKNCPSLLKLYLPQLCQMVQEEKQESTLELALYGMGSVVAAHPDAFQRDSAVLDKAFDLAMGGSPSQAKYAATFLAAVQDNQSQCEELVKNIADALPVSSGQRLISRLNALKRLAKYSVDAFETRVTDITTFSTSQLKRPTLQSTPSKQYNTSMDLDIKPINGHFFDDWCPEEDFLPEHEACLLGIKVLANRALALADRDGATQDLGVRQIFKLLGFILGQAGRPNTFRNGPGLAGRLRLVSATSLLKLGCKVAYHALFMEHFELFAWTMQDSAFQVRSGIIHKFIRYASHNRITNPKMNVALFLTAHDPDAENRLMPQKFISERMRVARPEIRLQHFELLFVRLIHLLAHHPDFSSDVEDLRVFSQYIDFFLECVANSENVSLLYYLAMKVKTVRDGQSKTFDEHLYILSELAQYVVRTRAKSHGWTVSSYQGQIKMPTDIFKALPDKETAIKINKTAYILSGDIEQLATLLKAGAGPKKPRQAKKPANGTSNGTSKKEKTTSNHKRNSSMQSDQSVDSSAVKPSRAKAKPKAAASKADASSDALTRKRKKGLKEWEDDTDDEEEDAENPDDEEEDDVEGLEGDEIEVQRKASKISREENKTRPSNLRQRPPRTSTASVSAIISGTKRSATAAAAEEDEDGEEAESEEQTHDIDRSSSSKLSAEATNVTPKSPKRARSAPQKKVNGTSVNIAETTSSVVAEDAAAEKIEKADEVSISPVRRTRRRGAAAS